jgi:hypothetical protein
VNKEIGALQPSSGGMKKGTRRSMPRMPGTETVVAAVEADEHE